jgi:hypothetical protein
MRRYRVVFYFAALSICIFLLSFKEQNNSGTPALFPYK